MQPVSPLTAILGGLLIGSATALFLLMSGRIAGVSGLVARAAGIAESGPSRPEALAFVLALPLGALSAASFIGKPEIVITSSIPLLLCAGLLVGFGTRLGNGCTSGHGVCGMARISPRSLAATGAFIYAGFLTVAVTRHLLGG